MIIFFNWDRLQVITKSYQDKVSAALRGGVVFFPHALGFLADTGENESGIHIEVPPRAIYTRHGFELFTQYVAHSLPEDKGRLEAAGFLTLLPRAVAAQFVEVGEPAELVTVEASGQDAVSVDVNFDPIAVLHIEHMYMGFRTWALTDLRTMEWKLVADGIFTKFPPCLPRSAYGNVTRGTA